MSKLHINSIVTVYHCPLLNTSYLRRLISIKALDQHQVQQSGRFQSSTNPPKSLKRQRYAIKDVISVPNLYSIWLPINN